MLRRLASSLALNRQTGLLLTAILLIHSGEEMWMRFIPKYLEVLGAAPLLIATYDALKTLLGAVYAYPGGWAADRFGHRSAFLAFTALSIAGYLIVALTGTPGAVIAAMFLFLAWTNFSLPATFSLVAESLPANQHVMGIGMQSLIRRIPVIVGPVAGGVLIDAVGMARGVPAGAAISVALAVAAAALMTRMLHNSPHPSPFEGLPHTIRSFTPQLRRLLFSDVLIRFCERLPFAWVIIYAMSQGLQATDAGLLTAIEMIAAIACYLPAAALADRYGKEPFVLVTFVMFTLYPLMLANAHGFAMLAVAFVLRGLKEFGEPARKSLIVGYAPPGARAATVGAYYLIRDVIVTSGSFLGACLWEIGPRANFLTAAGIGAVATIVYAMQLRTRVN
ncbi:MAG: MFS transporter [Acidobacteria bacterium]|nr:MFS transporter [Acidobacteriota bacterium]